MATKAPKKSDRISPAARLRISRAAKKRWREYRAAVARCDWRTARKLSGRPVPARVKKAARSARRVA